MVIKVSSSFIQIKFLKCIVAYSQSTLRDYTREYSHVWLFVSGHDAEQTAQYEAVRKEYLRQQLVKGWHDVGYIPPPEHVVG